MTTRDGEVLVLFPGALGDAVCFEPALRHLARHGPVTLHARGGAAEVATLFTSRPRVRSLDAVEVARLFAPGDEADASTAAWLAPFARIVSFTGAGIAPAAERLAATGRAVIAPFPRPPLDAHAADLFLRAVTGDARAVAGAPRLLAPEQFEAAADPGPPRLTLLPGSGGAPKRAAQDVFARLGERWHAHGGRVAVVLGPAEAGEERIWSSLGDVVHPASIADLARRLVASAAFVGNDAGPSHVAAALGIAGVVLYTVTDPAAFGPRGDRVTSIVLARSDDPVARAWDALHPTLP